MAAASAPAQDAGATPSDRPAPRMDANSQLAHAQLLEKAKQGGMDIYFLGDSITRRWGATDYPYSLSNWKHNFFGWNAANFGWGADQIQNILWRVENGELTGVNPKLIVIQAGTNNVGPRPADDAKIADVTRGLRALVDLCREKAPAATIVLTAIFPRNDNLAAIPGIASSTGTISIAVSTSASPRPRNFSRARNTRPASGATPARNTSQPFQNSRCPPDTKRRSTRSISTVSFRRRSPRQMKLGPPPSEGGPTWRSRRATRAAADQNPMLLRRRRGA